MDRTKSASAKTTSDSDAENLLAPTTQTLNVNLVIGILDDRISFYGGIIDALVSELYVPTKKLFLDEHINAQGEKIRDLQQRCRNARVVLAELRLLRMALQREMIVAPGANPSQL